MLRRGAAWPRAAMQDVALRVAPDTSCRVCAHGGYVPVISTIVATSVQFHRDAGGLRCPRSGEGVRCPPWTTWRGLSRCRTTSPAARFGLPCRWLTPVRRSLNWNTPATLDDGAEGCAYDLGDNDDGAQHVPGGGRRRRRRERNLRCHERKLPGEDGRRCPSGKRRSEVAAGAGEAAGAPQRREAAGAEVAAGAARWLPVPERQPALGRGGRRSTNHFRSFCEAPFLFANLIVNGSVVNNK